MKIKAALRRLSDWIKGHARVKAKPATDVGGAADVPASGQNSKFAKFFKRLAEAAAPAKIRRSVESLVTRAHELFDSSFRAKVLLPVVGCMAVAMGITFFVVDHRIAKQSEQEARNMLATANAVIRSSQDFRRNDLLLRFHNLPNQSLWRQIFQFGASKEPAQHLERPHANAAGGHPVLRVQPR